MLNRKNIFSNKAKIIKLVLYISITILILLILLLILFRNTIASHYVEKKVKEFNRKNEAELYIGNVKFSGFSTIFIEKIELKPQNRDKLIEIEKAQLKISIWNLFVFKLKPVSINISNFYLNLVKIGNQNNYSFLFHKPSNKNFTSKNQIKYDIGNKIDKLINAIFFKIPQKIFVENFEIKVISDKQKVQILIPIIDINKSLFKIPIEIFENDVHQKWIAEGEINGENENISLKVFSNDKNEAEIPFINYKWALKLQFDTLEFNFSENSYFDKISHIKGEAALTGLKVKNDKISSKEVILNEASINFNFNIGDNFVELDSNTIVKFNKLIFNPYIKFCLNPSRKLWAKVNKPKFPSVELFESFPEGLFNNVEGIKTSGDLSYKFDFFVNIDYPDSIKFLSELNRHNFKIISFGNTHFPKINDEFEFTSFEKGEVVRKINVGVSNPNFRKLEQISPYLKNAVLISEDAGFYWHRGFLPEAIEESITKNIKTKRFARGGSTISMQLVKNVFLNRNKTIARKVEEALIVWLIENNNLSSKERMFEVYLNIIEWGPMILGANEASHFYFNKDASKLTLSESLFLSNLIPKPKWFKYSFDKNGNLKQHIVDYMNFALNRMLKKQMITQDEFDNFRPYIELNGVAKKFIEKNDSIPYFQIEM